MFRQNTRHLYEDWQTSITSIIVVDVVANVKHFRKVSYVFLRLDKPRSEKHSGRGFFVAKKLPRQRGGEIRTRLAALVAPVKQKKVNTDPGVGSTRSKRDSCKQTGFFEKALFTGYPFAP